MTIFQLPQKLIIQLKRFTTRQQSNPMMRYMGNGKNNALITFPLENLDLSIAENKIKPLTDKYNLYGIVNHSGGLNGGHYTAHCKNLLDKKWYEFNDSSVSYVDDIKELCRLLKKKLDTTHEQDIKIDLKTMLDQTELLLKSVYKLFNI